MSGLVDKGKKRGKKAVKRLRRRKPNSFNSTFKKYMEERRTDTKNLFEMIKESSKERNTIFSHFIGVLGNFADKQ